MKPFRGKSLSWTFSAGVLEIALSREPLNEIGTEMLAELEEFAETLDSASGRPAAVIIHSALAGGFSAGADLRELFAESENRSIEERVSGVRSEEHTSELQSRV